MKEKFILLFLGNIIYHLFKISKCNLEFYKRSKNTKLHTKNILFFLLNEVSQKVNSVKIVYYSNSIVRHEQNFFEVKRPKTNLVLLKQIDYLGELLITKSVSKSNYTNLDLNSDHENKFLDATSKDNIEIVKSELILYEVEAQHNLFYSLENEHPTLMSLKLESKIETELIPKLDVKIDVIIPTTFSKVSSSSLVDLIEDFNLAIRNQNDSCIGNIIIVYGPEHNVNEKDNFEDDYFKNNFGANLILVYDDSSFNFSKRINIALKKVENEIVVIMNDDIEILNKFNLNKIVSYLGDEKVASCGVQLVNEEGIIQHTGMEITSLHAVDKSKGQYFKILESRHVYDSETSGNTFALVFMPRRIFFEVGFLDESLPVDFNDVEWCLRASKFNKKHITLCDSIQIHNTSSTRGIKSSGSSSYLTIRDAYNIKNSVDDFEWVYPMCCLKELAKIT
jgi:hypothetical protein